MKVGKGKISLVLLLFFKRKESGTQITFIWTKNEGQSDCIIQTCGIVIRNEDQSDYSTLYSKMHANIPMPIKLQYSNMHTSRPYANSQMIRNEGQPDCSRQTCMLACNIHTCTPASHANSQMIRNEGQPDYSRQTCMLVSLIAIFKHAH